MQNIPVYLYSNTLDVILDLDATVKGVNLVMYQRELKIQKGIKNQVRIQFKNSDQKNIRIYNTQTFVFSMFDAVNKRLMIEKPLSVLDQGTTSTKGLALLNLYESDTQNLNKSNYQYSIKLRDQDGHYTAAYSNTYYSINGTLQLLNDIQPELKDSISIENYTKLYNSDTSLYEHFSGDVYADPEFKGSSSLHTLAIYMTNYKGTVIIQGTLDNSPGVNANYSTITTRTYTGTTSIDSVNFTGVYSYIRIKHIPAKSPTDPDNDNPAFYGKFDKVLYRS